MSCLEFRRRALVSTTRLPGHLLRHADECRCCREFFCECLGLERALDDAVRVDIPAGLADRIVAAHQSAVARTPRRAAAWAAGLAAMLLLGIVALRPPSPPGDLALAAIDHVVDEPRSLTSTTAADPEIGQRMLAEKGVTVPAELGATSYVGDCIYAGLAVKHLVFRGTRGPVTVLVPIAATVSPPPSMTMAHGMRSMVVPTVDGFIAVVSDAGDATGPFSASVGSTAQADARGDQSVPG